MNNAFQQIAALSCICMLCATPASSFGEEIKSDPVAQSSAADPGAQDKTGEAAAKDDKKKPSQDAEPDCNN